MRHITACGTIPLSEFEAGDFIHFEPQRRGDAEGGKLTTKYAKEREKTAQTARTRMLFVLRLWEAIPTPMERQEVLRAFRRFASRLPLPCRNQENAFPKEECSCRNRLLQRLFP